ncbi:MAG: hypothetical protein K2Y37_15860 [Pirellulales bacterium]|nr:hypothetical protein [Pirellulales bacterium]
MHLTLHLTPEIETQLNTQAALTGKPPEELVLEALRDKFAIEPISTTPLATDEWLRQFDAWVSNLSSRNPLVDDSRESIYSDRD